MIETRIYDYLQKDARAIRISVFVEEQGFQKEFDELDSECVHFVLYDNRMPVGTCRVCQQEDNGYVIGRIAVIGSYRGKGIGRMLVEEAEKYIKQSGGKFAVLSAQLRVQEFYKKAGYLPEGKPYLDEYCPHISMKKEW